MTRGKRVALIVVAGLGVVAGAVIAGAWWIDRQADRPRREWKDKAVADVARDAADPAWVARQRAAVAGQRPPEKLPTGRWYNDRLALMRDGSWIAFQSKCHKEARYDGGPPIRDIFVGRASNGKWYYSTYHFCVRWASVMTDNQPETLDEFIATYFLKEFDGKSDEALKKTWPGGG